MADVIELKNGELLDLRKILLINGFKEKCKKRNIILQWYDNINWFKHLFSCDLTRDSFQISYDRSLTMNWSLKINIQKEIIFAITFEDWFLATLETVNLYHDQLTKIVGIVISGPQSNIKTSDSVMFLLHPFINGCDL